MEDLLLPLLFVAIPAIILMIAFVAFLRKEEENLEEDIAKEQEKM